MWHCIWPCVFSYIRRINILLMNTVLVMYKDDMHFKIEHSLWTFKAHSILWDCLFTDDLSKNKHATQSTTALSSTDDFIASKAVDRDITTCMRANPIGTSSVKSMWWRVDLGGVYNIYSVNILFKNYDGYGMY